MHSGAARLAKSLRRGIKTGAIPASTSAGQKKIGERAKGVILKCDTCQKNIEAESTQKEDREVEWGPCAPLYIRGKSVVCHDLFGVCACAHVCVCVRATRRSWGVCASNKISTKSREHQSEGTVP